MSRIPIILLSSLTLLSAACKKEHSSSPLPDGSITIQTPNSADTLVQSVSILKDSTIVIGLAGELAGKTSSSGHWVDFAVDTTKMFAYTAQYGSALLLPTACYFMYKPMVELAAGASLTDSAQLNIVQESLLLADTTYVLPVVIQSVDGHPDGAASGQVVYFVIKTGNGLYLPRGAWTIAGYSSYNGMFGPANVLDKDDLGTYWVSAINEQMPQYFIIDFNAAITFDTVNYYFPPVLQYPANGGYPTSIQIQTSMDGVNWVNNGVFTGNLVNNTQALPIGTTTAQYLQFTVLAVVPYAATYNVVFISGIELEQ